MKLLTTSAVIIPLLTLGGMADAQVHPDVQAQQLTIIADFADRICDKISTEVESLTISGTGQLDAELNWLARKLVGAGADVQGYFEKEQHRNLLREDLKDAMADSRSCKLDVITRFEDRLFSAIDTSANPSPVKIQDRTAGQLCSQNDLIKVNVFRSTERVNISGASLPGGSMTLNAGEGGRTKNGCEFAFSNIGTDFDLYAVFTFNWTSGSTN